MKYVGISMALAMIAGILGTAYGFPIWGSGGVVCLGALLLGRKHLPTAQLLVCLMLIALGIGVIRIQFAESEYAQLPYYMIGKYIQVVGVVEEKKRTIITNTGEMTTYIVSLQAPYKGKIYLRIPAEPKYQIGDVLRVRGKIQALSYYQNRGSFDRYHRDKEQHIFGSMYIKKNTEVFYVATRSGWRYRMMNIRQQLYWKFQSALGTKDARIMSALLFGGEYETLPPSLVESFAITGLIHILSVSGSHMILLFTILQLIGRGIGVKGYSWFFVVATVMILYGALSGFVAPVTRSLLMSLINVYSLVAKREYIGVHALGIAMGIMMLSSPFIVFDLGFQLSCGATAGILCFYSRMKEFFSFLPSFLCETTSLCVSAHVFIVPLLFKAFQAFPVYSLVANILVAPVLDVVIILGLSAAVISFFSLGMMHVCLAIAQPLLLLAIKGNDFLAALPYSRYWHGAWLVPDVILWYVFIGCLLFSSWRYRSVIYSLVMSCVLWHMVLWWYQPTYRVYSFDVGKDTAICVIDKDNLARLWYNKESRKTAEQVVSTIIPLLRYEGVFVLQECTLTGRETSALASLLAPYMDIGASIHQLKKGGCEMLCNPGIPYFWWDGVGLYKVPTGSCVELYRADTGNVIPPIGAGAWIVHCPAKGIPACTAWLQKAAYEGISCFSPATTGELIASYYKGKWYFQRYKGVTL